MYSRKDFLGTLLRAGALCGASGMLMLGERSALAEQTETLYFEAESMSFSSSYGKAVVSEPQANGGRVLMMTTRTSAFMNNVTFPDTANEVSIMVRAAQSSKPSWPVVAILVDGREVGRWTIDSTGYQLSNALISPAIPAGNHNVELRTVSGMKGGGTLWVDFIQFRRSADQQPSSSGTVYFQDGFDRDAGASANWSVFGLTPTTVNAPVRAGTHSLKLSANDFNTAFGARCDLLKDGMFFNGNERYIGFSVYFPTNMRSQFRSNGWGAMIAEPGFCANGGYPPFAMYYYPNLGGANAYLLADTHEPNGSSNMIWQGGAVPHGQWIDITLRIFFHDTSAGWIEMWINGVKQTFKNSQQRYYHNTLVPGRGTTVGGRLQHNCYRNSGIADNVTLYQDQIKVGSTYTIVQP